MLAGEPSASGKLTNSIDWQKAIVMNGGSNGVFIEATELPEALALCDRRGGEPPPLEVVQTLKVTQDFRRQRLEALALCLATQIRVRVLSPGRSTRSLHMGVGSTAHRGRGAERR